MNLNRVIILGNAAADPERRSLPNGDAVASFRVATNRFYTDREGNRQQETEFHNVVAFRRLGEIAANYLNKGDLVLVEGHLQTRSWEDPKTGRRLYRTEIIADNIQLPPRKWKQAEDASSPTSDHAPQSSEPAPEEIPVLQIEEEAVPESEDQENQDEQEDEPENKQESAKKKNEAIDPDKDISL